MKIIKSGNFFSVDAFLSAFSAGEHDVQKINEAAISGVAENGDLILYETMESGDAGVDSVLKEKNAPEQRLYF